MSQNKHRTERKPWRIPVSAHIDPLTMYIYDHYSHLLKPEELAALRYLRFAAEVASGGGDGFKTWSRSQIREFRRAFPASARAIQREGVGVVMTAARDRVLHECPERVVLNWCPRCRTLCASPNARQCLFCGFDWQHVEGSR